MTSKQKGIVAILAIANLVVIAGLIALLAHLARSTALPLPTPVPRTGNSTPGGPASLTGETCQWQAAQRMAQAGLGGAVTLAPGGALRFEIASALAPGQTADDAAQLIWTAFDAALALGDECPFTQVEVTIHIQDAATTLHASIGAANLAAYSAGVLSEDEFIDRVTYTIDNR
jgi:hypothetical protein